MSTTIPKQSQVWYTDDTTHPLTHSSTVWQWPPPTHIAVEHHPVPCDSHEATYALVLRLGAGHKRMRVCPDCLAARLQLLGVTCEVR